MTEVRWLDWTDAPPKGDADDFAAAGGNAVALAALIEAASRFTRGEVHHGPAGDGGASPELASAAGPCVYVAREDGLYWNKRTGDGVVAVRLTNFTARIAADVLWDDGAESRRELEIAGTLRGRPSRFMLQSDAFASMSWPIKHLGAGAVVEPGMGLRDRARVAIQELSGDVPERTVYAHLGWREVGGRRLYLHAGGAIGADGVLPGVEVRLPEALARYELPSPTTDARLVTAIRASLGVLALAPKRVTLPVFGAVYRAPIGDCDFGLHYVGPTGAGKTEIVALGQRHYGPTMDARHLPAAWWSTGNSLEALGFTAKDAVLVVDDFCPTGSAADIQRYHRDADRVFRAQGNSAGRQRLRPDATLKAARPPRGLIVSTGEDIPRGQSLRSRVLVVEVGPADLDWTLLSRCQSDAAKGLYAEALVGFLVWLARKYDELRATMRAEVEALREAAYSSGQHRRTPGIVADLAFGLRCFLRFARDAGAVDDAEAGTLWAEWWAALGESSQAQAIHQGASEPTRRFLELLGAAVSSGAAHVAAPSGGEPGMPDAWGWREWTVGFGGYQRDEWRAQGSRVGWVDGEDLYLEPDAAYSAVQRLARDGGDALAVTPQTLWKRLKERRLLRSVDQKRETLKIRKTFERRQHDVLHLHAASLLPPTEPDKPDIEPNSAHGAPNLGGEMSGSMSGSGADPTGNPTSNGTAPYQVANNHVGFVGLPTGGEVLEHATSANGAAPMSGGPENPTTNPTGNPTSGRAREMWRCACTALERRHREAFNDWVCAGCGLAAPAPTV